MEFAQFLDIGAQERRIGASELRKRGETHRVLVVVECEAKERTESCFWMAPLEKKRKVGIDCDTKNESARKITSQAEQRTHANVGAVRRLVEFVHVDLGKVDIFIGNTMHVFHSQ